MLNTKLALLALAALCTGFVPASTDAPVEAYSPERPDWAPEIEVTDVQADEAGNEMTSLFVASFDGTQIDLNVCRPADADADTPVPIVLASHGWNGLKANCLEKTGFFDAGIAFASMTQRGHHSSGGETNIMDPDFEGRDIMAVIDHLASLDWVAKDDGPGGTDPVLGGLGGSYGGGFQWVGAFTDQMLRDRPTRFNALSPGNTWYDLRESLAPQGVLRTVIVGGLYATGLANPNNNLAPWVTGAIGSSTATGLLLDGPAPADFGSRLHRNGAAWFVEQGMQLDIPIRQTQGARDLVFPLNDAINAFEHAITDEARKRSILANHHAGHGVPGQVPTGPVGYTPGSGQTCELPSELAWFRATLLGEDVDLGARLRLRTVDGDCHTAKAFPEPAIIEVDAFDGVAISNSARGITEMRPLLEGHQIIAGTPRLTFTSTNTAADARVFWGLAVGTSPEDALLIDAQWMPSRVELPSTGEEVSIELGAVVADVEEGQTLYLVASSSADQFAAHASRVPGVTLLQDVVVELPLLDYCGHAAAHPEPRLSRGKGSGSRQACSGDNRHPRSADRGREPAARATLASTGLRALR